MILKIRKTNYLNLGMVDCSRNWKVSSKENVFLALPETATGIKTNYVSLFLMSHKKSGKIMKHLKFPKNLTKDEKKLTSNRTLARNKNITIPLVAIKNVSGNQTDVTLSYFMLLLETTVQWYMYMRPSGHHRVAS